MSNYWAACYTHPQAEPDVRRGIEDIGIGAFLPSYANYSILRQRLAWRHKALFPGYVLFAIPEGSDEWGAVNSVNGVAGVLTNAGQPSRVRDDEMARLTIAHASGAHNVVAPVCRDRSGRYTKRRRRPRHGRAIRERMRLEAAV